MTNFPRNRRLRKNLAIREIVSEFNILASDFIYPLFVCEKDEDAIQTPQMKNIFRFSLKNIKDEIKKIDKLGIKNVMLFPYIKNEKKDEFGSEALNENNIIYKTIKTIKDLNSEINVISDAALDPYTTHGHDGVLTKDFKDIDNDRTIEILAKQALISAKSGADFISPSDMMDGRVAKIRQILDGEGFLNTGIISYAIKFASSLYAPFRTSVGSSLNFGPKDKLTYQIDPRFSSNIAIKSAIDDINQGADAIIIKPASLYLDIISKAKDQLNVPIFAYQVSGEYFMIKNYINEEMALKLAIESIIAMKRSGANAIISYFAKEIMEHVLKSYD